MFTATAFALIPPLAAMAICLATKEVNLSLFLGIVIGALMYASFDPFAATTTFLDVAAQKTQGNFGVLVFIVLLGMIVWLINNSGATTKYAAWAKRRLKTKRQSLVATMLLGILVFMDDYFSCLTVGTVMRPICRSQGISREKLAYVIDSTAAPVCIIAPVSSWAAAVSSSLPEGSSIDGFQLFMQTIGCNFYALFCLFMVLIVCVGGFNLGKMAQAEALAEHGRGELSEDGFDEDGGAFVGAPNSRLSDLAIPILSLILLSVVSMLYTGGLFEGASVADAFANCDAITGLAMGAIFTVFVVALLYLPRHIVTPKQFFDSLIEGFKAMVPASLILVLAWTLSGVCGTDYLNVGGFVGDFVAATNVELGFVPVVFFLVSVLLSFSTGTSWGTFAIMIPIVVAVFGDTQASSTLMVLSTAAVLSGSVCGDHLSPISDTTILSATAADCELVSHVETQLPYGGIVAAMSAICFLVSGLLRNTAAGLILGLIGILTVTVIFQLVGRKRATA